MPIAVRLLLAALVALPICAQEAATGVTPVWDVRSYMKSLVDDVKKMEHLINRADPEYWVAKGAPSAYVQQQKSAQVSMQHLIASTEKLSTDPEHLVSAIDTLFQLEKMELFLGSLREGIRKYQNSSLADDISHALTANLLHGERLRQHIQDLAVTREQEFKVINQEAQRCRGMISQQAPPEPPRTPARKKRRQAPK
jgi:hypothetical protein